jgi:predicted ATPase/class 3 adenylate cyclase
VARLPSGTVTFLFSDIEGSTRLLQRLGERYGTVLAQHRRLLRSAFEDVGGSELGTEGDSFFVVFDRARDALLAAASAQRALAAHRWPDALDVAVRMGIHTSEPGTGPDPYVGLGVHRAARICSAAHGGQVLLSATTRALLDEDIPGVSVCEIGTYRLKDLDRPEQLFQLVVAGLRSAFPPLEAAPVQPAVDVSLALPVPPTPTLGRGREIGEVSSRLQQEGVRLLTLTGPGGVGKTRLAVEVARRVAGRYADGGRFADLSSVSEPQDIPSAIARALVAPVRAGERPTAAVMRFVGTRQMLLVLDNLEHVLAAMPLIADLLAASPGLTVLATSREPTRLAAEHVHPLAPLDVPPAAAAGASPERYAAVALFCARARARDPSFTLDAESAPHVSEVCRRLDGLPLALELAAARVGLLSAADLAGRLDHALGVLVAGARDAPERQRTLRATIDWSVRLLTAPERRAFSRMAVFGGGVTVDGAERVTGASLDALDSLVAKHLLVRRDDRLVMLATVREYAREELGRDVDRDEAYTRLVTWCLAVLRRTNPGLVRADRLQALSILDAELPNALAALSWAIDGERADLALELATELGDYWWETNHSQDGLQWLEAALALGDEADTRLRAKALLLRARLTGWRSAGHQRRDLLAALALFEACDASDEVACCLAHLACLAAFSGDFATAATLGDDAIRHVHGSDDEYAIASVLTQTALIAHDYADAAARSSTALVATRRVGDLEAEAFICGTCGYAALASDHHEDALAWLDTALEAGRQLQHTKMLFAVHTNRGLTRLFLGEVEAAAEELGAALATCDEAGAEDVVDETLLGLAAVEAARGLDDRAARLTGAALRRECARSTEEEVVWTRLLNGWLAPARARLGPEHWENAMREGGTWPMREVAGFALRRDGIAAPAAPRSASAEA